MRLFKSQTKDRDSMSIILSGFHDAARDKANNVKLEGTEKQKNTAARRMLYKAVNQIFIKETVT